ncbi:MAG: glucose-1-phosphate thymidylyltransferase RfbA [Alphaproteobacteria bacterium]|nr:glucose-1-phosphate thymidylyltransferase RfbA [Alphaproteobacteria bacterium]OJV15995.1 MAG: glucose-1-phosphate thymidylyltransferase [Alphaproteobacteria bacterium 33-17]
MKGILLAGGNATRLYPITMVTNKHLLPIYNKPMIYYSLSTLMLAGIRDILLISSPRDIESFKSLLGNGSHIGISIEYAVQNEPKGIAECFKIGKDFIGKSSVSLSLGDNIFYGANFENALETASSSAENSNNAVVFGYYVSDPERYGVLEFNEDHKVISIEEKPKNPKSHYAVIGVYFYPNDVVDFVHDVKPSGRGELEITDINNIYLHQNRLNVKLLNNGFAWLDTGTCESLIQASNFIHTVESRQNLMVGSIEQIAFTKGYINDSQLMDIAAKMKNVDYGKFLAKLAKEGVGL